MKVEVAVLGSLCLTGIMISGVKQHQRLKASSEIRGGRSGFPVPNSPYGLCGRKAKSELRNCVKVEVGVKQHWT